LTTQARTEAQYEGGLNGWRRFLEKNVDPMYLVEKNAPSGTYTAIIKFVVNEDGTASNFVPETDLGYGIENELISKMQNGARWVPATMFGRKVKAYRRQPITLVVSY
jgi:protein TonB